MAGKKSSEDKSRQPGKGPKAPRSPGMDKLPRSAPKARQRKKTLHRPTPPVQLSDEPDIPLPVLSVESEAGDGSLAEGAFIGQADEPALDTDAEEHAGDRAGEVDGDEPQQVQDAGPVVEFLSFDLGEVLYAFRFDEVEEIVRSRKITHVPGMKPFVLGITSIRGKIVPVVDIARLFREDAGAGANGAGRIIVLKSPRGSVGVLIGRRINIISVTVGALAQPPSHMPDDARALLEGVARHHGRFVSIIDAEHMLGIPAIRGLHEREARA